MNPLNFTPDEVKEIAYKIKSITIPILIYIGDRTVKDRYINTMKERYDKTRTGLIWYIG
ncbi:MAG: hypothetical protein Q8934_05240 [Bacillota bacterium]|jgi:hypothetical protein|nr:hypothetical protein [Bacillota bacterium]